VLRPLTGRANGLAGPSARTRVLLVLGGVVGVLVAGYLTAYVLAGPGIARGTTVLGVSIGGMAREEAARTLTRALRDEARAPVPVRAGAEARSVRPATAGLRLDVAATVDAAAARSWNPADLLDALVGGDEVPPVVAVDRTALAARMDRLADRVDRAPVEGGVRVKGTEVRPVTPVDGLRVQRRAAADAVVDGYLDPDRTGPVELPTRVRPPVIGQRAVDRAVAEVAEPAVSAPVALTVEGTTVQLPPEAIGAALVLEPRDGELVPRLRGGRLHAAVAEELAPVEDPARDASFEIVDGTPRVVPSRQGREVLPASLAAAVLPVVITSSITATRRPSSERSTANAPVRLRSRAARVSPVCGAVCRIRVQMRASSATSTDRTIQWDSNAA